MLSTQLLDDFVEPDEAFDLQRKAILPDLHLLVEPQNVFKLAGLPRLSIDGPEGRISPATEPRASKIGDGEDRIPCPHSSCHCAKAVLLRLEVENVG